MTAVLNAGLKGMRGELRLNEPLARYVSWRVGGAAERFYRPANLADLCAFLKHLSVDEPIFWLGLGSNLLVRDGGIRGTVIATQGALQGMERIGATRLRIEAGVPCAKVARFAARHDLTGIEFLAGIPGTVGGALAMNAGAWGGEIWPFVSSVETVDHRGELRVRPAADYRVGYRDVRGPEDEWFVAAVFELETGDGSAALLRIRELLDRRAQTQPMGLPSCGSVFRNPPGDYAARLIETAGLKGVCIGGACVSTKHANFIINTGAATAADIETLIGRVADIVAEAHGVRLVPEVRIVGEQISVKKGG